MAGPISIGPGRSRLLEQALMQAQRGPSRNWGEAIGKIAQSGVAAWKLSKEQEKEQKRLAQQKQTGEQFLKALMGGGGLAAAVGANPDIVDHPNFAQYSSLAKSMMPKPAPETFSVEQNPYGRGGVAQKSSTTGKFSGYQQPVAAPAAPERRIIKGADGFNYYTDTQERVIPGAEKAADKTAGTFEPVLDDAGNIIAQKDTLTGKVVADPRASVRAAPPDFKTSQGLRKEFKSESGVFIDTQDAIRRVVSALDRGTAAGDLAAVFNFMKTLDPGSVVRESEYRTAENARDIPESIRNMYNRALDGHRLSADQRGDFLQTAGGMYTGQLDQQERKRTQYTAIADAAGLSPGESLIDYIDQDLLKRFRAPPEAPQGAAQPQAAPPAAQPAPDAIQAPDAPPGAAQAGLLPTPTPQGAPEGDLDPETKERVSMIPGLKDDQLENQAQTVAANPDQYSDAEKRALALEWQRRFGGG